MAEPTIFICIPVHNRLNLTINCIESILSQTYKKIKIIICDDGSSDGTAQYIRENYPYITLLSGDGNLWWTGATNECINHALRIGTEIDFIFTMNNDSYIEPKILENLISIAKYYKDAILGCVNVLSNNGNLIEPSAFREQKRRTFSKHLRAINNWNDNLLDIDSKQVEVDALSGKGVLVPLYIYSKIGIYNFEKLPHYYADCEFTYRAKKSDYPIYLVYYCPISSFTEESALGQLNTKPNLKHFLQGFFNIKSSHHLRSLFNFCKLSYKKYYFSYFLYLIAGIVFDYLRYSFVYRYDKK